MPTTYHYHPGSPCNPPAAGLSCNAPGDVIACNFVFPAVAGGRLKCVHYIEPEPEPEEEQDGDSGDSGDDTPWEPPPRIKLECRSMNKGLLSGIVMGGAVHADAMIRSSRSCCSRFTASASWIIGRRS